jgi:hypothetical protein
MLRFTMHLTRGDDARVDRKTGKDKLFEIAVRTPVHILSVCCLSSPPLPTFSIRPWLTGTHHLQCYARAEYTALPRYSETLDDSAMLAQNRPDCPCAAERQRREREVGDRSSVEASRVSPTPLEEEPSELLGRTLAYERLVSGRESALGDAPPAYEARPTNAPHPQVISV